MKPDDIEVIRVRRPETYGKAAIGELLVRALNKIEFPGTTAADLYIEWYGQISHETFGLFVGLEDGEPRAIGVALLPTSRVMLAPQVVVAYNEGRPDVARRVGERIRSWLMEHGHHSFLAVNLRHSDAVFMRGMGWIGRPRVFASLILFEF